MGLALVVREHERVRRVRRRDQPDVALEQPMAQHPQAREHRPAQHDRVDQRRALDVLDHVRQARGLQPFAGRSDQVGVAALVLLLQVRVGLAWRRGVDHVEAVQRERQRVGLVELKRVVGLLDLVDADDLEAGPVIAETGAAGAAEQVEQPHQLNRRPRASALRRVDPRRALILPRRCRQVTAVRGRRPGHDLVGPVRAARVARVVVAAATRIRRCRTGSSRPRRRTAAAPTPTTGRPGRRARAAGRASA